MKLRYWMVAGVLLLGGAGGWLGLHAASPSAPRYRVATVDRGPVVAKVSATGTLSALVTVQVGSQVSGRISRLSVDYNSPVHRGEVLATLDPQLYQAALEREQANDAAARSGVRKAELEAASAQRQLVRARYLSDRRLIAPADLETAQVAADMARAQIDSARANLQQAAASLRQARVNLGYTTIASPVDGVVVSRNVDVGQTVAASLAAPTLFVIAQDLRKMQVDTSVSEADIGRLKPGLKAEFSVDAFPGEVFAGKVRQIRNAPQTQQNIVTYDAVIDLSNAELRLRPGMTANVSFIYAEALDALRVPNAALRFQLPSSGRENGWAGAGARGPDASGSMRAGRRGKARRTESGDGATPAGAHGKAVWVLGENDQPHRVRVEPGISDGSMTEVPGDRLKAGDRVIIDLEGPTPEATRPAGRSRQRGPLQ